MSGDRSRASGSGQNDGRAPAEGSLDRTRVEHDGGSGPDKAVLLGTAPPAGERYVVLRRLGEGGASVVYEARDEHLGRIVALKVLRREHLPFAVQLERFADEVRIMGSLDHPGTVPVYEAGALPGGEPFYTMKRVRGSTLGRLLAERSAADVRSRHSLLHHLDIFRRACQAVAAAHAAGVVHRDIKPDNVMVDTLGAVLVMDWGLAKRVDPAPANAERTQLGAVVGTPAYMPPEQARGLARDSGTEADVFSLGVVLYEILTGARPFAGATYQEIAQKVIHEDPVDPRRSNRSVSRQLAAICMKALDKNPLKRYPTAGALEDDLRRFREFLPISAARPTLVERLSGWARRRPVLAGAAAALLLATLAGIAALALQAASERQVLTRGFARIADLREDLDRSDEAIGALEGQIAKGFVDSTQRAAAEQHLAELRARRSLDEQVFQATVSAMMGFTWLSTDEDVQSLAKQQVLDAARARVERGEDSQARTTIQWLLASLDRGNPFGLTEADRGELLDLLARASGTRERRRAVATPRPGT
jgi:tRNA A-37 threonylcarbamoyl transferase component Bud32